MKKKQYYLRGGLSQPKCLRDRPHRKRAVLEAIVLGLWAGPVETTWTHGENIRRRKFLADAPPAPALLLKPPELNPSGQRRFLSSLQQSSSIAIGDQQSMAATAAAPLDEGKAKKVLRQVRDPALLPQLHNIFFPFFPCDSSEKYVSDLVAPGGVLLQRQQPPPRQVPAGDGRAERRRM